MATVPMSCTTVSVTIVTPSAPSDSSGKPRLHRIKEVRRLQGVSLRSAANNTGVSAPRLRTQEEETTDLRISDLHRWQKALDVPLSELLEEPRIELSGGIHERAQMVRLMKTAAAMLEAAESDETRQLARSIVDELVAIMPELKDVGPWHSVGQRRGLSEMGRVMEHTYSVDVLLP